MKITLTNKVNRNDHLIILADNDTDWNSLGQPEENIDIIKNQLKKDVKQIMIPSPDRMVFVIMLEKNDSDAEADEMVRKAGNKVLKAANNHKIAVATIHNASSGERASLLFAEGMALGNYQFIRFKKNQEKESNTLEEIRLTENGISKQDIQELNAICESVYLVRDLVNLPANYLNATGLAAEIVKAGKKAGFKTEVFNKAKIASLKMGGLLAVNQGSVDPPTFTIMEYKPKNALNKKPIVLVGKGVVYDTGGLSLKPTPNSMDYMKCDMAGAATITGAIYCSALTKLPLHLIGLVPSTDNRPGGNAFAPGDVITMHNGLTVEMLNSDAEGRMILGDALSFARQYKPEFVVDVATLTGAAHRAVGDHAIVYLSNAPGTIKNDLEESGHEVFERLIEFPLWEEYGDMLKSDIADMKNVGGTNAGAITAGKFLERFTDYPWIHLDIAGIAFLSAPLTYKGKNASGIGLRLLYRFLKKRSRKS